MLWPSVEDLRGAPGKDEPPWKDEPAWDEGPPLSDVVVALIPALRVLFLQGWRTVSINFAEGMSTGQSTEWRSLDVATLELTTEMLSWDREWSGLNVAFDVVPMNDTHGPAQNGYSMWVEVLSLGIDEPMATNGKIPHDLEVSIDDFVETGVERLAALIPFASLDPPRADNQGLLWVFHGVHWWGLPHYGEVAVDSATQILREEPADFIRGQVYDDSRKHDKKFYLRREHPDLEWLCHRPNHSRVFAGQFWQQIAKALQGRGEAHRLTIADRGRLPTIGWLDAIVELLTLGAIDMDGLITAVEPVEPLVAHTIDDENATLVVWGEQTINLIRSTPLLHKRSLEGSVAWDYWEGDHDNKPRVLLVVSRGIEVGDTWRPAFPWVFDIIRVQDDSLVPSEGEAIDPTLILTPALLEPQPGERGPLQHDGSPEPVWTNMYPRVAAKPKRDGLFLEYPIWGQSVDPAEPSVNENAVPLGTPDRFGVELTFDPRSGHDGFIVDVHYYIANYGQNLTGGAHICIWASEGVTINANGRPNDGFSDATSQASQMTSDWSGWTTSAEFWEAERMTFIKRPFQGQLPITPRLAYNDDRIDPTVRRFSDNANRIQYFDPETDEATWLVPKHYTFKNFHYEDSFLFDFFDAVLGFVPFVGDVADIAEVAYVWNDRLRQVGPAGVGLPARADDGRRRRAVALERVRRQGRAVGRGTPEALVHGDELIFLFSRPGGEWSGLDDVEAALSVSDAWKTTAACSTPRRAGDGRRADRLHQKNTGRSRSGREARLGWVTSGSRCPTSSTTRPAASGSTRSRCGT